jgi:ribosomal protein L12E/L44/L45/RPP1/RPP2
MKEKEMIFGIRAVMEAVEAGKDIDKVMVKRELSGLVPGAAAAASQLRDTHAAGTAGAHRPDHTEESSGSDRVYFCGDLSKAGKYHTPAL